MDDKDHAQNRLDGLRKTFPLGLYTHYKGGYYVVYGLSVKEDTLDIQVHYYSTAKKTRWTRTWEDFTNPPTSGTEPYRGPRFKFKNEVGPLQLLEAAGFDQLLKGYHTLMEGYAFLKSLHGG